VLYYAPEIFKTMGANTDVALLQQIIVGAINLSFTVLASFTEDNLVPSANDYRSPGNVCRSCFAGTTF
jgi:hypothetical protein